VKEYKNPTCKGSYALHSACGKCERCEEERAAHVLAQAFQKPKQSE